MKTSESIRTSAIAPHVPIPFAPRRDLEIRSDTERRIENLLDLGVSQLPLLLQEAIHCLADELGEGFALPLGKLVEPFALLGRQVDLRPRAGHRSNSIQQHIQHLPGP